MPETDLRLIKPQNFKRVLPMRSMHQNCTRVHRKGFTLILNFYCVALVTKVRLLAFLGPAGCVRGQPKPARMGLQARVASRFIQSRDGKEQASGFFTDRIPSRTVNRRMF